MSERHSKARESSPQRGYILVLAMMLAVFMVILTSPFVARIHNQCRSTDKGFDEGAALALAEAGAERALWEINYGGGTWTGWSGTTTKTLTLTGVTAAGGTVVGDVAITAFNHNDANPVVESAGTVAYFGANSLTNIIRLVLEIKAPLFGFGIFGNDGLTLGDHAIVDSYDSRLGPYGGGNIGQAGAVGTNSIAAGTIYLSSDSRVNGDASVGFQGDPATGIYQEPDSVITGQKNALATAKEWPNIPPPTGLPNWGNLSVSNGGHIDIILSGRFGNVSLGNGAEIHIHNDCDLYVAGNFFMGNDSRIRIDSDARVRLFFGGTMFFSNNAQLNNQSHDPSRLIMYGCNASPFSFALSNDVTIYAGMYFPNSTVILANNSRVYGSIVAKQVTLYNNAQIHHDRGLGAYVSGFGNNTGYTVKSWQEKL
jgi:hypothetical protein